MAFTSFWMSLLEPIFTDFLGRRIFKPRKMELVMHKPKRGRICNGKAKLPVVWLQEGHWGVANIQHLNKQTACGRLSVAHKYVICYVLEPCLCIDGGLEAEGSHHQRRRVTLRLRCSGSDALRAGNLDLQLAPAHLPCNSQVPSFRTGKSRPRMINGAAQLAALPMIRYTCNSSAAANSLMSSFRTGES